MDNFSQFQQQGDGFERYQVYILEQISRLDKNVNGLQEKMVGIVQTLGEIKAEIGILKVKAGAWGMIAGTIAAAIAILLKVNFMGGTP